jgi:hypothetical protein
VSVSDPIPAPRKRSTVTAIAVITVVAAFLAGALVGVLGDHIYMMHHRRGPLKEAAAHFMAVHIAARLDRELSLTPSQHDAVLRILEVHHKRMGELFDSVRPQMRQEIEKGNAEIELLLDPTQREKFKKLRLRMAPRGDRPPAS